jgi:hypothetical protein
LNETLINVALTKFMAEFSIPATSAQWLTTGYMLVIGILVPAGQNAAAKNPDTAQAMSAGLHHAYFIGGIILACAFVASFLIRRRVHTPQFTAYLPFYRARVWTRIQSNTLQNERYLGALLRGRSSGT